MGFYRQHFTLRGKKAFSVHKEKSKRKYFGDGLNVFYAPKASATFSKFAIGVNKKSGCAVKRNRFKRLVREHVISSKSLSVGSFDIYFYLNAKRSKSITSREFVVGKMLQLEKFLKSLERK